MNAPIRCRDFCLKARLANLFCLLVAVGVVAASGACEKRRPAEQPGPGGSGGVGQTKQSKPQSAGIVLNVNGPGQGETPSVLFSDALAFGTILMANSTGGLSVDDERRIVSGEAAFKNADLQHNRTLDQKLQVKRFTPSQGTAVVQVNISNATKIALTKLDPSLELTGAPALVDHLGQRYTALGYVFRDTADTQIRFHHNQPLTAISDLPRGGPSVSRPDQNFMLIFCVSTKVKLTKFMIGDTEICRFDPKPEVQ